MIPILSMLHMAILDYTFGYLSTYPFGVLTWNSLPMHYASMKYLSIFLFTLLSLLPSGLMETKHLPGQTSSAATVSGTPTLKPPTGQYQTRVITCKDIVPVGSKFLCPK